MIDRESLSARNSVASSREQTPTTMKARHYADNLVGPIRHALKGLPYAIGVGTGVLGTLAYKSDHVRNAFNKIGDYSKSGINKAWNLVSSAKNNVFGNSIANIPTPTPGPTIDRVIG